MGMDIRWPIGLMFLLIGAVLTGYGFLSGPALYEKSLGINVNLIWGVVLVAFGLFMAALGRRAQAHPSKTKE